MLARKLSENLETADFCLKGRKAIPESRTLVVNAVFTCFKEQFRNEECRLQMKTEVIEATRNVTTP